MEEQSDPVDHEVLPGIAMVIGTLCQNWADLEHGTVILFSALSGMKRDPDTFAIVRCFGFRDQLAAIKVTAACRVADQGLADLITETVDYIDSTLRPRRNRIVHDRWSEAANGRLEAHRWDMTPKVKRTQSRTRATVLEPTPTVEPYVEIMRSSAEIGAYAGYLCALAVAFIQPSPAKLAELLSERPQRPFPLRQ